jgi:hypothetical protein
VTAPDGKQLFYFSRVKKLRAFDAPAAAQLAALVD